jgi:hypothetical protein
LFTKDVNGDQNEELFIMSTDFLCRKPIYETVKHSKADFESGERVSFKSLGITCDSIYSVSVLQNNGLDWEFTGGYFYIKDKDTLIIPAGGVFFEAVRKTK